jgi:alkanesulfonate monooxygenase SsuD/methylene tetrahydromethanopterin reductase-like flavin-dependent oxidoreductase (luciferase family)
MDVGIGLPNAIAGTSGKQLVEWSKRADSAGFSSLGTVDRVAYRSIEPLAALAAAAAVTERIKLATTILIAPVRVNAPLLAKQIASVHHISGGRMVAGLAVGPREDDYTVSGLDFGSRGKAFDEMLPTITQTWADSGGDYAVGPDVSQDPPKLIIGGSIDAVFRRAAEHGDGWIMGGGTPDQLREGREKLLAAWSDAGRDGQPHVAALAYYALGDDPEGDAQSSIGHYYAWLGEYGDQIVASAANDEDTIRGYQQGFEEAGCDEIVWFPAAPDPEQVDLLAAAAL